MTARRRSSNTQPDSDVDLGIVDALVQASFIVHALLAEVAAEHDLSIIQLRLLGILRDREPRMAQLARALGLTKSSATGLVDRAQRRGLVARTWIPVGDERAVHVVLTDGGRDRIQTVAGIVARRVAALVDGLPDADRDRLSALLSDVVLHEARLRGLDIGPDSQSAASTAAAGPG